MRTRTRATARVRRCVLRVLPVPFFLAQAEADHTVVTDVPRTAEGAESDTGTL